MNLRIKAIGAIIIACAGLIAIAVYAMARPLSCAKLTVLYVENPRFNPMRKDEISAITTTATSQFKALLGRCVIFEATDTKPISDVFSLLTNAQWQAANKLVVTEPTAVDRYNLSRLMAEGLADEKTSLAEQIAYANRSGAFSVAANTSLAEFATALISYHAAELSKFRLQNAADGRPIIDSNPYNEYVHWSAIPHTKLNYDLYITNQPIISLERGDPSMHASLRGGITNGLTTPCAKCSYGTAIILSVYPLYGNDSLLTSIRTEAPFSEIEKTLFSAQVLTHELGHQLLHLGHPFALQDCVMNPVEGQNFRKRSLALSEGACAKDRSATLELGAIKFPGLTVPFK